MSEDLEHGMNKVKRAFVGGTGTSDTASETAHHASNRAGEIANRIVSHIIHLASPLCLSLPTAPHLYPTCAPLTDVLCRCSCCAVVCG